MNFMKMSKLEAKKKDGTTEEVYFFNTMFSKSNIGFVLNKEYKLIGLAGMEESAITNDMMKQAINLMKSGDSNLQIGINIP